MDKARIKLNFHDLIHGKAILLISRDFSDPCANLNRIPKLLSVPQLHMSVKFED